jgi:hypothetical protein
MQQSRYKAVTHVINNVIVNGPLYTIKQKGEEPESNI